MKMNSVFPSTLAAFFLSFTLATVRAQYCHYSTNNGEVCLEYYTGDSPSVVIPEMTGPFPVTSIAVWAFQYNTSLQTVTIPNTVVKIGTGAFYQCTALTNVTFGNHVANIGNSAFLNCALTRITFPASLTNLADYAFQSCSYVREIYFLGNAPTMGSGVFLAVPYATGYYLPLRSNWGSYLGSMPTYPWDPQMIKCAMKGDQFGFSITGAPSLHAVVELCTNLSASGWAPIGDLKLISGSYSFTDADGTNCACRFYRLRMP